MRTGAKAGVKRTGTLTNPTQHPMTLNKTLALLTLCALPWLASTAHAAEAEGIQVETILQTTTS
jgi:hypothetical protein